MKIVAMKTIKMKIDSYIDSLTNEGVEIARIELSSGEFLDMWKCCSTIPTVDDVNIRWTKTAVYDVPQSGSYFLYRGICIQHHSSYKSGDLGVEYI